MTHTLTCPSCAKTFSYASDPKLKLGELIVCNCCFALTELHLPGPHLALVDEKELDDETRMQVAAFRLAFVEKVQADFKSAISKLTNKERTLLTAAWARRSKRGSPK